MATQLDRNPLDRPPTSNEVIAGILCCIVLILVGGAILVFLVSRSARPIGESGVVTALYLVGAFLGGLGLAILLRIFFTPPRSPSKRAQHIAALAISFATLVALAVKLMGLLWR